jgi:hypothetical protein
MMVRESAPATSLTEADVALIRGILRDEILRHRCRLPISDEKIPEVVHAVGMITDLGKGDLREGVEILRDNHKAMLSIRNRISQLATAIGTAVLLAVVSGVVAACWLGIRVMATVKGAGNG